LIVYRIPKVRKSVVSLRKTGMSAVNYIMAMPWLALFLLGFIFIINEEVFKGVAALVGSPIDN
jgi:hypothetical protein